MTITSPSPRARSIARTVGGEVALRRLGVVNVFDEDRALLTDVPAVDQRRARAMGDVLALGLPPGRWVPTPRAPAGAIGLLVYDGLLIRTTGVRGSETPELLGAGDLLRPWEDDPGETVAHVTVWQVLAPTRLAVLDRSFAARVARWPPIVSALLGRALARSRHLALLATLGQVRPAELRLLLVLWHLADRWGVVRPEGVALPLPVTHAMLADMAGMRRPTATTALSALAQDGLLSRIPGGWVLHGDPP